MIHVIDADTGEEIASCFQSGIDRLWFGKIRDMILSGRVLTIENEENVDTI